MKRGKTAAGATFGAAALTTIVLPVGLSEAQSDQTQVRFLHAVAGAGPASLLVERGAPRLPSSFAKPSGYRIFRPGEARLRLVLNGQSRPVATEVVKLGPGKYTVVAIGGDDGVDLLVYEDAGEQAGKATLRAVHVASEVGKADVRVDGKVALTDVGLGDASGYLPVPPGRHNVAITRPGGTGGALVKTSVNAVAGTSATAWVVGSGGMPAEIVLTQDVVAAPTLAPATGLGGATSDGGWLLIVGSSILGGGLGATSYVLARRRRGRGSLQVTSASAAGGPPHPSLVAAGPALAGPQPGAEKAPPTPAPPAAPVPPAAATPAPAAPAPAPAAPAAPARVIKAAPKPVLPPMRGPGLPSTPETPAIAASSAPSAVASIPQEAPAPAPDVAEEQPETPPVEPRPVLWSPPPTERWPGSPGPKPRFTRQPEPETAEPEQAETPEEPAATEEPKKPARFVRAEPANEPEKTPAPAAEEPVKAEPAPRIFVHPLALPAPTANGSNGSHASNGASAEVEQPKAKAPEAPAKPEPAAKPEPTVKPDPAFPTSPRVTRPAHQPVTSTGSNGQTTHKDPAPKPEPPKTIADVTPIASHERPAVRPEPAPPAAQKPAAAPTPIRPGVTTWNTGASRPATATSADKVQQKVNFLVVSGAALVVTGLVVARRGGRH